MEILSLPLTATPSSDTSIELSDGTRATLGTLPVSSAQATADAVVLASAAADATSKANAAQAASQPLDSDLTAIAALTTTAFGRSLLTQADAEAGRTALGISATNTPNTPAGNIAATTVQAALNELDSEKTTAAAALAAADAAIKSAITAYSPQGYLNSDGATANRGRIQGPFDAVNNPRGWVAGAATLTDRGPVPVPSASSTAEIFSMSSSITALASATAWSYGMAWSGNDLVIRCNGATPATDFRTLTFTGLRTNAAYIGQTVMMELVATSGTTDPVLRVNEMIIAGTPATGGGTTPNWLSASLVPTYHVGSYLYPAGITPLMVKILGTLTDADRAFHRSTGQYPAWVVAGGSAAALITNASRNSDFSAGATDWTVSGGSVAVVSSQLQATFAGVGNAISLANTFVNGAVGVNNCRLRLRFTLVSNPSLVGCSIILRRNSDIGGSIALPSAAGDYVCTFDTSGVGGGYQILFLNQTGAGVVTLDNIYLDQIGALSLPGIQPCAVVDDLTTIGGNQARLVGVTAVTNKKEYAIRAVVNMSTTGNKQLLSGALFADGANVSHDTIDLITTGTPTLSIGDGTTLTKHTASTAISAGRTRLAITSPFPTAAANTGTFANVTVTGGAAEEVIVRGHLLN